MIMCDCSTYLTARRRSPRCLLAFTARELFCTIRRATLLFSLQQNGLLTSAVVVASYLIPERTACEEPVVMKARMFLLHGGT